MWTSSAESTNAFICAASGAVPMAHRAPGHPPAPLTRRRRPFRRLSGLRLGDPPVDPDAIVLEQHVHHTRNQNHLSGPHQCPIVKQRRQIGLGYEVAGTPGDERRSQRHLPPRWFIGMKFTLKAGTPATNRGPSELRPPSPRCTWHLWAPPYCLRCTRSSPGAHRYRRCTPARPAAVPRSTTSSTVVTTTTPAASAGGHEPAQSSPAAHRLRAGSRTP